MIQSFSIIIIIIIIIYHHHYYKIIGRLAQLIAHSGAVILLQDVGYNYHFSTRLQPWVHFVPLTYSMSDATEKIEWLIEHDDMARQIARNAINFGMYS